MSAEWSITLTLQAWWVVAYLLVGAVLLLPLEYVAHRGIHNPGYGFWRGLQRGCRDRGLIRWCFALAVVIAAWPVAAWEVLPKKRQRSPSPRPTEADPNEEP